VSLDKLILSPLILLMAGGCVIQHQRYDWGSYDRSRCGNY